MKRSAVSIPSNIAEGSRKKGKKDKNKFYIIAFGSVAELETQLEISRRLGFVDVHYYNSVQVFLEEISKMLNKMVSYSL